MAAFYEQDQASLDMWDNYVRITDTGVWMKIPRQDAKKIRRSIIEGLKDKFQWSLLQDAQFNKFVDMTFKKDDEVIAVRSFRDGRVQVTTRDVPALFATLVPHIEGVLGKRFRGDRDNAWWAELFVVVMMIILTLTFTAIYYNVDKEHFEVLTRVFGRYSREKGEL